MHTNLARAHIESVVVQVSCHRAAVNASDGLAPYKLLDCSLSSLSVRAKRVDNCGRY